MFANTHADDAERLREEIAAREAEVTRLREIIADHDRRADAARDTADRRMRVNDLAARYAGEMLAGLVLAGQDMPDNEIVGNARALAEAVVAAEEAR